MMESLIFVALIQLAGCAPHQDILDFLQRKYEEVVISSAVHYNGGLVETVVNKETGTWSTLLTMPMRSTCIVASGTGWRAVVPKEILGEEDA